MLQTFAQFIFGGFALASLWGASQHWDKADRKGSVRIALRYGAWGALLGIMAATVWLAMQ
jgi:hypothetical protein